MIPTAPAFGLILLTASLACGVANGQDAPLPDVDPHKAYEVAPGVTVIPDSRVAFVPNVGMVQGTEAVLVVDTGISKGDGQRVLDKAREIAGKRKLYLTTTHFHPEHSFGASVFAGHATYILNRRQADELKSKGTEYIGLFSTFGPALAERLAGTTLAKADQIYADEMTLDLGGRKVILRETPAHTRGDQLVYVPDVDLIFTGDLAEPRFFPIMPDADSNAEAWIEVLRGFEALRPAIVVPGHGAVGDVGIILSARLHIEFMRERVRALVAEGHDQQAITDLLVPAIPALYPGWDNANFLPFEIAILYAEATRSAPRMPSF